MKGLLSLLNLQLGLSKIAGKRKKRTFSESLRKEWWINLTKGLLFCTGVPPMTTIFGASARFNAPWKAGLISKHTLCCDCHIHSLKLTGSLPLKNAGRRSGFLFGLGELSVLGYTWWFTPGLFACAFSGFWRPGRRLQRLPVALGSRGHNGWGWKVSKKSDYNVIRCKMCAFCTGGNDISVHLRHP